LLDEHDCALLFCATGRDGRRFWFTPGGGAEPDESPRDAAARELTEETGAADIQLSAEIWRRTVLSPLDGQLREFRERWFLARTQRFDLDTTGFDQLERDTILEHRWWSLSDLRGCPERLAPPDLPDRLEVLLRDGLPTEPIDLTFP
jgi:8-oxo-dGTP pyrophosphatase MutT (NUDIX family)